MAMTTAEYTAWTQPNDANALGTLFGGKLMQWVDLAAALAASRHARAPVVTASIDYMTFLRPVHIGQLVVLKSTVNRVFRTSMEVGVKVFVEDLHSGETAHVSSAYLTFVSVDSSGKPVVLPPASPVTELEQRRWRQAGERREHRLQLRQRVLAREQQ
jgi:acyl-CoA hydrolase